MSVKHNDTIAILGCGGFIGSHLLERILSTTDWQVEGVDVSSRKISGLLDRERFTFHSMDVGDANALYPLLERCTAVISLTALCNPYLYTHTPIDVIESNFVHMYPLVKACSAMQCRLIHFSTSEVYGKTLIGMAGKDRVDDGDAGFLLDEKQSPLLLGPVHAQRWSYACAKQLLERTIFAYGFERGLEYTIIRPFNFIGPRMDYIPGIDGEGVPRVIACFMDALLHGKPLQLVDGGGNRRCFTAISDAVDAIVRIIERPDAACRKIFNIGNPDNETTIKELAERMIGLYREVTGETIREPAVEYVASRDFYGEGYEDSDRRVPAIGDATELLGWQPVIDLDEALRLTVEGFIKEYGKTAKRAAGSATIHK